MGIMTLCTLLILLLLLVCASAATSITAPPVLAEFQLPALIVGFTEYKPHESHQRFLAASLAAAGDGLQCIEWNVMKRKARIMRFPSDFALLQIHKISSSECDSMTPSALMERGVAAFSRVPGVAYVRVDSPVQVVPLSTDVQCDKTSWHDVSSSGSAECTWTPQSRADSLRPLVLRRGGTPGYGPDWLDVQNDALNDMNSGRDCVASVCSVPSLAWSGAGLGSERNGSGPGARCLCDGNLRSNHQDRGATSITDDFEADVVWNKGFTGKGVKVAVFDTGLRRKHPHFRKVVERTNWTSEHTLDDGLGHGTFVAGIIASQGSEGSNCRGFAPDADLYIFRVFTNKQVSYTSWFLDAFNYAIHVKINVLNLSIGGPDFNDRPFVDKILELSANGVIVVSAIGNDGPLYGTLNNPADQSDVIAVGGINRNGALSQFSSRGMTTWELPRGYGRAKPDVVAYAQLLHGSRIDGGCRTLSGTSVASPVVAGAITLLASAVPPALVNPASMKQALLSSAVRLPDLNLYEQGAGRMNVPGAFEYLSSYTPRVTLFPDTLNLTDCPYMWPYCEQPLFFGSLPAIVNVTVLNGIGLTSRFAGPPEWVPGKHGDLLDVRVSHCDLLWPWTGWMAVSLEVRPRGRHWKGVAHGKIVADIETIPDGVRASVQLDVSVNIAPTPPRNKRVLVDIFHNLRYPSAYVPCDDLEVKDDVLDWNADHPHTNFRSMFAKLLEWGYTVEILGVPWTCFDAENYGVLLVVDPEDDYHPLEIAKLQADITSTGLSLVMFVDWYNSDVADKVGFFDENTKTWWTPITGGANVPAVNELLDSFGIAFGSTVYSGALTLPFSNSNESEYTTFSSGNAIAKFPEGGYLWFQELAQKSVGTNELDTVSLVPVAGIVHPDSALGRLAVHGDSNCVDDTHSQGTCWWLLHRLLTYAVDGVIPEDLFPPESQRVSAYSNIVEDPLPERRPASITNFNQFSHVAKLPAGEIPESECDPLGLRESLSSE